MYVLSNNVKICIYMTYKLLKIKGYIYTVFWKSCDYCKKKNTGCAIGIIVQKIHVLLKY